MTTNNALKATPKAKGRSERGLGASHAKTLARKPKKPTKLELFKAYVASLEAKLIAMRYELTRWNEYAKNLDSKLYIAERLADSRESELIAVRGKIAKAELERDEWMYKARTICQMEDVRK